MPFELAITLEIVPEDTTIAGAPLSEWEEAAEKAYVEIMGPLDRRTCPDCMPHVGVVYRADDPDIVCWTHGTGMHPRCRHWAEPTTPPDAEARSVPGAGPTGSDFVEQLIAEGRTDELEQIFGPVRAGLLAGEQVTVGELYGERGTYKKLEEMGFTRAGQRQMLLPGGGQTVTRKGSSVVPAKLIDLESKRLSKLPGLERLLENHPVDLHVLPGKSLGGISGQYSRAGPRHAVPRINLNDSLGKTHTYHVGSQHFSVTEDARGAFRHEVGHHLLDVMPEPRELEWQTICSNLGRDGQRSISQYAVTNYDECFCESFAAFTSPLYTPGDLPVTVEQFMRTLLEA